MLRWERRRTWVSARPTGDEQSPLNRLERLAVAIVNEAHAINKGRQIMSKEIIERVDEELIDTSEVLFDEALDLVETSYCIPNCRQ